MRRVSDNGGHTDYERAQRGRSLYRVLAGNLVRQLRDAGYQGHELLDFASEVMQAIADNGWDAAVAKENPATAPDLTTAHPCPLSSDSRGRPTLTGPRTVLRVPGDADRPQLERWNQDPLVRNSVLPTVIHHILDNLADLHSHENRIDFIIGDLESGVGIGLISLHEIDERVGHAELGKLIGEPSFRGRGFAEEATRLVLHYAFGDLGINRVFLRTLGGNLNNIRLNEKLGFRFEGVLQEAAVAEGRRVDVVLMAMLRREFLAQQLSS